MHTLDNKHLDVFKSHAFFTSSSHHVKHPLRQLGTINSGIAFDEWKSVMVNIGTVFDELKSGTINSSLSLVQCSVMTKTLFVIVIEPLTTK